MAKKKVGDKQEAEQPPLEKKDPDWVECGSGREGDDDDEITELDKTHYAGRVIDSLGPQSAMGRVEDFLED